MATKSKPATAKSPARKPAAAKTTSAARSKAPARKPAAKASSTKRPAAKSKAATKAAPARAKTARKTTAGTQTKSAQTKSAKSAARASAKTVAKPRAAAKPATKPAVKPAPVKAAPVRAAAPAKPAAPAPAAPSIPQGKPHIKAQYRAAANDSGPPPVFKLNDHVVYPAHGVGKIVEIEQKTVAGMKLELFVITFDKDKMTLRVPTAKVGSVGMRKLSSPAVMESALKTLKGRARIKRTMWSRRAQEYEAKINSGDLMSIAEVVRDLHRAAGQPEQSYSERQLYEAALSRMAREVAAIERIDEDAAVERVETALQKVAA